jgi:hypothetical protein
MLWFCRFLTGSASSFSIHSIPVARGQQEDNCVTEVRGNRPSDKIAGHYGRRSKSTPEGDLRHCTTTEVVNWGPIKSPTSEEITADGVAVRCLLWVKLGPRRAQPQCLLYPPITDINDRRINVGFVPQPDSAPQQSASLFDHLVGTCEHC